MSRPGFRTVRHTADLALRVEGNRLDELFVFAVRGLHSLLVEPSDRPVGETKPVFLEGDSPEWLLWRLLNEIVYLFDTEGFLTMDATIDELSPGLLRARLLGRFFVPGTDVLAHAVKAATCHDLVIARAEGGDWNVTVIFDT